MAKLVLSSNGAVLHQYFIDKERLVIGRGEHNEVVVEDPAVSREHASITTVSNDQIIEDLQSSNGTFVNGARITRQILHHGDVIDVGPFNLRYLNPKQAGDINLEHTMLIEALPGGGSQQKSKIAPEEIGATARAVKTRFPKGSVKVLFGPRAPNIIELNRVVAAFGRAGEQLAVITRRPMGYFITHVDGPFPRVNRELIGKGPRALAPHDVIEVGGDTLEFLLDQEGR
ncbi:MAG TPA: FHA domain-containing protein [Burkholderiales bacterium]|nr:FHA domain-containing protein [Burkholderiales bacterium]